MQLKKWLLTNIELVHKASMAVPISIIPATICYFHFYQNRQPILIYDLVALLFPLYVEIWGWWQTGYSFQSEKEQYEEALSYYLATGRKIPRNKEAKEPIFHSKNVFYTALVLCTASITTAIYIHLYSLQQYINLFGNIIILDTAAVVSILVLLGTAIQKLFAQKQLYPPDQQGLQDPPSSQRHVLFDKQGFLRAMGLNKWKTPITALLALVLLAALGKSIKSQYDHDEAKRQTLITAMEKGTPYEFSNRKYRITEYRYADRGEELTLQSQGGAVLVVGGPLGLYQAQDRDKQIIDAMENKTPVYYNSRPYKIGKYNLAHYEITLKPNTGYAIVVEQDKVDIGQPRATK